MAIKRNKSPKRSAKRSSKRSTKRVSKSPKRSRSKTRNLRVKNLKSRLNSQIKLIPI